MSKDTDHGSTDNNGYLCELGKDALRAALIAVVTVLVSALSETVTKPRRESQYDHWDDFDD